MTTGGDDTPFHRWMADLEARHFAELTFPEVSRALRALSCAYVERRRKLSEGAALSGAGKRAAFALFYGPLHFLLIRHVAESLTSGRPSTRSIVDLGCGTGVAGAAWGSSAGGAVEVVGIDRHPWAAEEARRTYRAFDLNAKTRVEDLTKSRWPDRSCVIAAFAINELDESARQTVGERLRAHVSRGGQAVVVEPLAGFVAPWWNAWRAGWEAQGGNAAEWRVRPELPALVAKLDRAAGLDHRELTGRTLTLGF
jgi:SAM-dependent methyltransferase